MMMIFDRVRFPLVLIVLFAFMLSLACTARGADGPGAIRVREGFKLTVAEQTIKGPRFMALAPDGTLYVSVPDAGQVRACRDENGDGIYEKVTTFVSRQPQVHGLCWHDGWLWFTRSDAVLRARDTNGDGKADETVEVLKDLPHGGHWWRPVLIHAGRLYTGIGDSGNITDQSETKRQKIWSYTLDGKDERLFISGIRNTEKLVVRPGTEEIWGMDHGSDWYGQEVEKKSGLDIQPITDYLPPDEMNHYVEGKFYGHPFIVGNRMPRLEYLGRKDIVELAARTVAPEWCSGAHWAPNAMMFYTGAQIPGARGDAFVAYHGSWNRSKRAGYCVTRVHFEDGHPWGEQVQAWFLSDKGEVQGRPVDVIQAPDGSLLVSDDYADRIYRLSWVGAK